MAIYHYAKIYVPFKNRFIHQRISEFVVVMATRVGEKPLGSEKDWRKPLSGFPGVLPGKGNLTFLFLSPKTVGPNLDSNLVNSSST